MEMEVSFPHFTWSGKMSATVGSDKLPLCILITNATTNKTMQINTDESQLNYFIMFRNSQGGQENKVRLRNRGNTYKTTVKWQTLSLK